MIPGTKNKKTGQETGVSSQAGTMTAALLRRGLESKPSGGLLLPAEAPASCWRPGSGPGQLLHFTAASQCKERLSILHHNAVGVRWVCSCQSKWSWPGVQGLLYFFLIFVFCSAGDARPLSCTPALLLPLPLLHPGLRGFRGRSGGRQPRRGLHISGEERAIGLLSSREDLYWILEGGPVTPGLRWRSWRVWL